MSWLCQCAAVIPCFNEAAQIAKVVTAVRKHLPQVIVVDDGSTDFTGDYAADAGAEVIRHPANCGKGAALQTGWKRARERNFLWALTLDGDAQHAPEDMPQFFARAEVSGAPLVVGNRLHDPQAIPWLRRHVNRWMTHRLSRLAGQPLADSQCGFRLVHLETLGRVSVATRHFEVESEMLVAFVAAGYSVEFVPVRVIYHSGGSKIRALPDTWRWLRWWFSQGQARPKNRPVNALCAPVTSAVSRKTAIPSLPSNPPVAPFPATRAGESRV